MPDFSFAAGVKQAIDYHKIQKSIEKNVDILVGFPGGRPHVTARHDKDKKTKKKKGGADISADKGKPLETWQLAMWLHYGTESIPARPFLEEGLNSKKAELAEAIKKEIKKAMNRGNPNWDKIGTMAVGAVQEFVRSDYYKGAAPNSPEWQEKKGSDTPLIDSADLINSLTYVVKDKR